MLAKEHWQQLLTETERQQRFLDMLCNSAAADYRQNGGEIFCGKGCGSCCTLAVHCTATEAALIAATLTGDQIEAVAAYVTGLCLKVSGVTDLKSYLRLHRRELGGCPFLQNGLCGIYPTRPLSCRSLLSTMESYWCGIDFTELSPEKKQEFLDGLDRNRTAFPTHYLAATQTAGHELESQSVMLMLKESGFALSGSMPVLVCLFSKFDLLDSFRQGINAVHDLIAAAGFDSPYLLQVDKL